MNLSDQICNLCSRPFIDHLDIGLEDYLKCYKCGECIFKTDGDGRSSMKLSAQFSCESCSGAKLKGNEND